MAKLLNFRPFQQIKKQIAAWDARPKSVSGNAFTTIFAFQFLVSFGILAVDLADVALTIVSIASSNGFSVINAIVVAVFHLSTICFSIAMWAKLNNVAGFWTDMSVFSSLVVWIGFSLVIFVTSFTNSSSCFSQIIAGVNPSNSSQDYQCSGYHLSISMSYALTALWEAAMYFICALIWARKCHRLRGYNDLELLERQINAAAPADTTADAEAPAAS